jgi:hypothetical protein
VSLSEVCWMPRPRDGHGDFRHKRPTAGLVPDRRSPGPPGRHQRAAARRIAGLKTVRRSQNGSPVSTPEHPRPDCTLAVTRHPRITGLRNHSDSQHISAAKTKMSAERYEILSDHALRPSHQGCGFLKSPSFPAKTAYRACRGWMRGKRKNRPPCLRAPMRTTLRPVGAVRYAHRARTSAAWTR